VVRRHIGLGPREHARIGRPERLIEFQELSYHSALVPLFGTDLSARGLRSAARQAGRRAGIDVRASLIRTRNPGKALVEEAERLRADVIYVDAEHAPATERALGPTISYLLAKRPCRVVVALDPSANGSDGGNGTAAGISTTSLPGSRIDSRLAIPRS
jgi:hypothetical protein